MEDPEIGPLSAYLLLEAVFKPFTVDILIGLLVMILLLFLSAMISGSEIAFFSLDPPHLREIREDNSKKKQCNTAIA